VGVQCDKLVGPNSRWSKTYNTCGSRHSVTKKNEKSAKLTSLTKKNEKSAKLSVRDKVPERILIFDDT